MGACGRAAARRGPGGPRGHGVCDCRQRV